MLIFLTNETIFGVRGGGGGGDLRIVLGRQKMSTIYFAPTPKLMCTSRLSSSLPNGCRQPFAPAACYPLYRANADIRRALAVGGFWVAAGA